MKTDMVNHPPHYKAHPSGIETIKITQMMDFCTGNAWKYIARADHKGSREEDLNKAIWYVERAIDMDLPRREHQDEDLVISWIINEPEKLARKIYHCLWRRSEYSLKAAIHLIEALKSDG